MAVRKPLGPVKLASAVAQAPGQPLVSICSVRRGKRSPLGNARAVIVQCQEGEVARGSR